MEKPEVGAVHRIDSLDGLRGAAAVVVVAFHALDYVKMSPSLLSSWLISPLGVVVNGPGAVHLFFVLSGYVLALTLAKDPGAGGVARFYAKRVFRLQPPYAAAVLVAWVASIGYPIVGGYVLWLRTKSPCFHIPGRLLPTALILPSVAYGQLPVGWSLYVELMMSAAFPALLWLGRRLHPLAPVVLGLAFIRPFHPLLYFARFGLDFGVGLALCLERQRVARWMDRLPRAAMPWWLLGGVVLLQLPFAVTSWERGLASLEQDHGPTTIALMSIGSGMLVAAAAHLPAVRYRLSRPMARFFGRISYSLYLVHMAVLALVICRVTGQRLPWYEGLAVFAVVLAISIGAAEILWRTVEHPAIRAGRWVSDYGSRFGASSA